jgi:hypothetical protein
MGNPEGRRLLKRPRRRCVDSFEMDIYEIGFGGADWIGLVQEWNQFRAVVNTGINRRVP